MSTNHAIPSPRYAVYHRKDGLQKIAQRVHGLAQLFASEAQKAGLCVSSTAAFFDTAGGPGKGRRGRLRMVKEAGVMI